MTYPFRKSLFITLLLLCIILVGCRDQDKIRDDALRNVGSSLTNASGGMDFGETVPTTPTPTPTPTNNEIVNNYTTTQNDIPQNSNTPKNSYVVFVHGWNSSDDVWNEMRSYLASRGISQHAAIDLPERGLVRPIPELAKKLGATIDSLAAKGATEVSLVSHSMGGLVCREYLRTRPSASSVAIPTLVTIATPHHGTQLFTQDRFELIGCTPRMQMNPASEFIQTINAAGAPADTKVYSIWTPEDEVIAPPNSCVIPWANNYQVNEVGSKPHSSLLKDSRVFEVVHSCLAGKN